MLKAWYRRKTEALADWAVHLLTDPVRVYNPVEVTNVHLLKRRLRPADVVLISGNARISYVVKVLTMSQWSHIVLYVGDRRDALSDQQRELWTKRYGSAALNHLVVDADPLLGVHLKPLDDYVGLMVRHCRPEALGPDDRDRVIAAAMSQLGRHYDIRHILRLLLFFAFPWELLPESLRRLITDFNISDNDRICSRVISEAFHAVGYPIRPLEMVQSRGQFHSRALGLALGWRSRRRTATRLLKAGKVRAAFERLTNERYAEIHLGGERNMTPADFDLSRFFSVIKDKDDLRIAYRDAKSFCMLPHSLSHIPEEA